MAPEPGDGTVIVYDTNKNRYKPSTFVPEFGGAKFRGSWSAGEIVKTYDFAEASIPAEFILTSAGPGMHKAEKNTVSGVSNFISGTPGPYTNCMVINIDQIGIPVWTDVALDLSKLNVAGIVSISAWMGQGGTNGEIKGNAKHEMRVNNGSGGASNNNDVPWTKRTMPATSADTVSFRAFSTYGAGPFGSGRLDVGVTGIEIVVAAKPYMKGDFVTHDGVMWESEIDNNGTVPGAPSAAWEASVVLPPASGTTAQRPNAATVGKGFQYYDESLSKPIWSTGAVWKDASASNV